jgi:DNA-directed RNA polymerase subunit RPC12/RpoP
MSRDVFVFPCVRCGKNIRAFEEERGRLMRCNHCSAGCMVPLTTYADEGYLPPTPGPKTTVTSRTKIPPPPIPVPLTPIPPPPPAAPPAPIPSSQSVSVSLLRFAKRPGILIGLGVIFLLCAGLGVWGVSASLHPSVYTREDFEKEFRGVSLDLVRRKIGSPDNVYEAGVWRYNRKTIDPVTRQPEEWVIITEEDGRVVSFRYSGW